MELIIQQQLPTLGTVEPLHFLQACKLHAAGGLTLEVRASAFQHRLHGEGLEGRYWVWSMQGCTLRVGDVHCFPVFHHDGALSMA